MSESKFNKSSSGKRSGKFLVGISQCLLGEPVRYDGGHKRHSGIVELLGPQVQWVPVCPEVGLGLPVPREPMVLVGDSGITKLVGKNSGKDYTWGMKEFCRIKLKELADIGLDGFIFKKSSPSCGLQDVNIFSDPSFSEPVKKERGFFANEFRKLFSSIPVVEEDELNSPEEIETFVQRMSKYKNKRID